MRPFLYCCLFLLSFSNICLSQQMTSSLQEQFEKNDVVDCIIVMRDQLDLYGQTEGWTKDRKANFVFTRLQSHADQTQKELRKFLEQEAIEFHSFYVFNGLQGYLTQSQADRILTNFEVKQIVYNAPARVQEISYESDLGLDRAEIEWGLLKIKADSVWQMGYEGEGVVVAGQDTGYDFDNGLILSKYRGYDQEEIDHNYNWHDAIDTLNPLNNDTINDPSVNPCGFLSVFPCDDHGHGSHTMGTMVGGDTTHTIGVAPAASWIGCRNMDRGWGKPSTYTECFEWFLAPTDLDGENPDPSKAPHVINNSWGCPTKEGCTPENWFFMETVVNNLTAAGTVVVVSAGNDGGKGCSSIENPASIFENSFTVGATRDNDTKPNFSSIGPVLIDSSGRLKPDVMAPGVGVKSIWLNDGFNTIGGTSMAGPHVAGAIALIINANPSLAGQVDVIKDILRSTAVHLTDSLDCSGNSGLDDPNFYFGHGRIDVFAAVKMALEVTGLEEIEEKSIEITVSPNPNTGDFVIATQLGGTLGEVYIRDISGRVVQYFPAKVKQDQILVENLSGGIYIYSIRNGASVQSGKVIVTNY
ncbi:MAG: S8 family peptidase [Saprospiraceae bacterium]|nr:S8 family peptidase [Saprospiraceae bacterium]